MITFLTWVVYLMMVILTLIMIIGHLYLYFSTNSITDNKIHVDTERLGITTSYITFMWFVVFVLENPLNL